MVVKSGRPTGAGRPSGTAEQRAYHGTRYSPSGTPRTTTISPVAQRVLKSEIEANPEKFKHLHAQYGHLWKEGYYPYVVNGKAVTKATYQVYEKKEEQARIRESQRVQAERTQAERPLTRQEAFMEAIKAKTPREKFETALRLQVIEKERKKIIKEKKLQEALKKPIYHPERALAELELRKKEVKEEFVPDIKKAIERHKELKKRYYEPLFPAFPSIEKYRAVSLITAPSKIVSYVIAPEKAKIGMEYEYGLVRKAYVSVKEKPEKIAAMAALGFAVPPAIAGLKLGAIKYVAPVITKVPAIAKVIKPAVAIPGIGLKYGLPTLYVAAKVEEIREAPTPMERGAIIGEAIATEVAPLFIGAYFGARAALPLELKADIETAVQKLPSHKKAEFRKFVEDVKRLSQTEIKVKKLNLKVVERLDKKSAKIVEEFLLKNPNIHVGGSVAQRTQVHIKPPKPSDLDLYTPNPKTISKQLFNALKKAGVKRVSRSPKTGAITIRGQKAVEIHEIEKLIQNIKSVSPYLSTWRQGITTTPRGVKVLKLSIQAQRKLVGGYLEGRYGKDVPHFKGILRSMIKEAKKGAEKKLLWKAPRIKELEIIRKGIRMIKPLRVSPPAVTPTITAIKPKEIRVFKPFVKPKPVYYPTKKPVLFLGAYPPYKPVKVVEPYVPPYKVKPPKVVAPYKFKKPEPFIPYKPPRKPTRPPTPYIPKKPEEIYIPFKPKIPKEPFIPYKPKRPEEPYVPFVPPPKIRIPPPPEIIKEPKPSPLLISALKKIKKVPAWELFVKRFGKFKKIGEFEKVKAIKFGAKITKETLAATFMIKPLKKLIVAKPSPLFIPSPKVFRAYKVVKGKKVPLEFTWIQKREFRLGTPSEISEIQRAKTSFFKTSSSKSKKKSKGGFKWF